MDLDAAKQQLIDHVDAHADLLLDASHEIHAHPELGFQETRAHALLTDRLEQAGLKVERGAFGLDTAFAARAGGDGPTVAVMCEYDALPAIGHACGHNIIAAAGLGAGLAAAALADELGGRVVVLGTPAEEGGGGKVLMAERGALDEVVAALMVHPSGYELTTMTTLAIQQVIARYQGVAAHAAAFPHRGRNALDAAVLGYVNVAALRQHIAPDERVHGIFLEGGDKPNIVPARASQHWYVRSGDVDALDHLKERVVDCLTAGATAAGCDVDLEWLEPAYADLVDSGPLLDRYVANAARVGRHPAAPTPDHEVVGSTDMGNVSHAVPSIHPMIKVAPPDVSIHTPAFADHAASADGDRAVLDGAKALALTVADVWNDPELRRDAARTHAGSGAVRA